MTNKDYQQERNGMPHWSQFVPVYGLLKAANDYEEGKPSILDEQNPVRFVVAGMLHHNFVTAVPLLAGLTKLLE